MGVIIISCCSVASSVIIYFYILIKKNEKDSKTKRNKLPQTIGCEHSKNKNTYFYNDKIYCEFCWSKINNNILLYYNYNYNYNLNANNKKITV